MGVAFENIFCSKLLVNHLLRFGFSITPEGVLRFNQSAIENMDNDLQKKNNIDKAFAQWTQIT